MAQINATWPPADVSNIVTLYGLWHSKRNTVPATFELSFRTCPFQGEYVIFAGLEDALNYISSFEITHDHIEDLRSLPECKTFEERFFEYLKGLNTKEVKVFAQEEGSMVFPKVPLMRVEGPLDICQLLESSLINLVNYPCLVATNAARHRLAVGPHKKMYEFGVRRAQGPNGGLTASKYAIVGGFDATSNLQAAIAYGLDMFNDCIAHSYIQSFIGIQDAPQNHLVQPALDIRERLQTLFQCRGVCNDGELAAFLTLADASPDSLMVLVDTYDTLKSGVLNFLAVILALHHKSIPLRGGVRLDSGDLAWVSTEVRKMFKKVADAFEAPFVKDLPIMASNDLREDVLYSLSAQGHEIDQFAIGTHLVTCEKQSSLGIIYKLVWINGQPRIKCSQTPEKLALPGRKEVWRLHGSSGAAVCDLMTLIEDEEDDEDLEPEEGHVIPCRDPFVYNKRMNIVPQRVQRLLRLVWDGSKEQPFQAEYANGRPSILEIRQRCLSSLKAARPDITRPTNPTGYKVSVSQKLFDLTHDLWYSLAPATKRPLDTTPTLSDPQSPLAKRQYQKMLLVHGSYWEYLYSIATKGVQPNKGRMDLKSLDTARESLNNDLVAAVRKGHDMRQGIPGLEDHPDFIIEFEAVGKLKTEENGTVHHEGSVSQENITRIIPNYPDWLPTNLHAKIVNPKDFGAEIPVVDLSRPHSEVLKKMQWACEKVGFMQIVGHGISNSDFDALVTHSEKFFNRPLAEKSKLVTSQPSVRGYFGQGQENLDGVYGADDKVEVRGKPKKLDQKELYDMKGHPCNQGDDFTYGSYWDAATPWPTIETSDFSSSRFRQFMERLQSRLYELSKKLLSLIAEILDLPPDFFEACMEQPVTTHRILHYSPQSGDTETQIGIGAHTDYGLLTLLHQDQVGGLHVLNAVSKEWIHCPPIKGAFVVNLGDMLARWTSHRFQSTVHRVVNATRKHRYSSPYFIEPHMSTIIDPGMIPSCKPDGSLSAKTCEEILVGFYKSSGQLKEPQGQKDSEMA